MELLEPKAITVTGGDGKDREFYVSKFPAWDGLEILTRFPSALLTSTAVPKVSDWKVVEEMAAKIMSYVAVDINGRKQRLETKALIDNHTYDAKTLGLLIVEEVRYNHGPFERETISAFFEKAFIAALAKISEAVTQSSAPSSPLGTPL